ncbi:hypothetical protein LTR84_000924 [Exophiala bonariae]|uniref:Zn(2)-C6 fungal-type domain-containing protein n=1 Tax=Exophiala bonariae TaxID=1690606 RepID=A0AAV9NW27_9EURO|nr:hypothetical protein LTR84_000924 [Exophiala bonariae]
MPKAAPRRTFTACWTCRGRNIRCDAGIPGCSQCARSRITCEGYHFNLVWVDPITGSYTSHQRRAYPCHLTWHGFPSLTLQEVDHLIGHCKDTQCRCPLHQFVNPFTAFSINEDLVNLISPSEGNTANHILQPPSCSLLNETVLNNATAVGEGHDHSLPAVPTPVWSTPTSDTDLSLARSQTPIRTVEGQKMPLRGCDEPLEQETRLVLRHYTSDAANVLAHQPTQPWMVNVTYEDGMLFHHFLSNLSKRMVPVDDDCNPWKTVYPSLAMQTTRSSDAEALYHALLAQSAFQLANLKGSERGAQVRGSALRHYGIALSKLRQSLIDPSKDYTTVLAALYTVILAEHVFQGTRSGWHDHIRGAKGFVSQFLSQQPWKHSREAYTITQNFGLAVVISSTSDTRRPLRVENDEVGELENMLNDLMSMPDMVFGYTLGGTPHILKAIYQIRLLEVHVNARRISGDVPELDDDMFSRVGQILQLLHIPLHEKLQTYVCHRESNGITVKPQLRTLAETHLRLFNTAVSIYLFCIVLRSPPSTVAADIRQVLVDARSCIDVHDSTVSIWPLFVAAVEAYELETQTMATYCLDVFKDGGAGNRSDVKRVVQQVWKDRDRLATELQCNPGEVSLDWRETMKKLEVDILLL